MKKYELKQEYYLRKNASNILTSQNIIVDDNNINTFITFYNCDIVDGIAKECIKKEEIKKQYTNVLEYIAELSIHKKFAHSIVESIANNQKHFCNSSCMDIVKSGYTQDIFEDIQTEVYLALDKMYREKKVWLENNELKFETFPDKNNKPVPYYVKLYHTVYETLYNEKKNIDPRYTKIKYNEKKHGKNAFVDENGYLCDKFGNAYLKGCKIEYLDSYNDDTTSTSASDYRQFLYSTQQENALENVAYREDIKKFFRTIKALYPKYYSDFCGIFECFHKGYTYKETATILHTTERRIKYLVPIMRDKYNEILVNGINIEKQKNSNIYCDTTRNTSTTYYIKRTRCTMVTPTIKKVQVQEDIYKHSIKNYEYDLPQWQREQWQHEKEEQQQQLLDNVTQHINVVDIKNKTIVVINQDGQKLYSMPLKTKDYRKFARKHNLEIL